MVDQFASSSFFLSFSLSPLNPSTYSTLFSPSASQLQRLVFTLLNLEGMMMMRWWYWTRNIQMDGCDWYIYLWFVSLFNILNVWFENGIDPFVDESWNWILFRKPFKGLYINIFIKKDNKNLDDSSINKISIIMLKRDIGFRFE